MLLFIPSMQNSSATSKLGHAISSPTATTNPNNA